MAFAIEPLRNRNMKNLCFQPSELAEAQVTTTNKAAALLNRAPQTLRKWACLECGPIRPIRINGRLAWRVSDLQSLLNGGDK